MIEPENLLSQNPFQIFGRFEPNFLLTQINVKVPKSKKNGDFIKNSILYSSTLIHEYTHWKQFMGTTWGNWCVFMHQSRQNLFFNDETNEILKQIEYFKCTADYELDPLLYKRYPNSYCLFYEDWLSHTITYNFFITGDYKFSNVRNLSKNVSTALSFTYFSINNFFSLGEKGLIKDYEKILYFDDLSFLKPFNESFLTVKMLLEGQARATEVIHFLNLDAKFPSETVYDLINDSDTYWGAFKLYLKIHNLNFNDIISKPYYFLDQLTKFITLVDIALNPELPPFVSIDSMKDINWSKIYPPFTFFKACHVSSKIQFKIDAFDESTIIKYYYIVCYNLNILTPFDLTLFFIENNKKRLLDISNNVENGSVEKLEMFDYISYTISKFSSTRLEYPLYIPNSGLASIGYHSRKYVDILLNLEGKYDFINTSPLVLDMNKNEKILHTPLKEDLGKILFRWLTTNLFYNHITNNFIMKNKKITDYDFPFTVPDSIKEYIIRSALKHFDKEIVWN